MDISQPLSQQLLISAALMAITTFVHGVFVAAAGALFRLASRRVWGPARFLRDAFMLVLLSLMMMVAHIIEIGLWAATFLHLNIFETLEAALYFAAVSFTTLGFGDVLLPEEWRLLSGAAAANGLLLFGVSAAFMLEMTSKLRMASISQHPS
ncbi:MAG: ion channel [Pseudomonadota bacterium]